MYSVIFQKEAIPWAWEFLTEVCGLEKDRFYITYFGGTETLPADEEAKKIWIDIGLVCKYVSTLLINITKLLFYFYTSST